MTAKKPEAKRGIEWVVEFLQFDRDYPCFKIMRPYHAQDIFEDFMALKKKHDDLVIILNNLGNIK